MLFTRFACISTVLSLSLAASGCGLGGGGGRTASNAGSKKNKAMAGRNVKKDSRKTSGDLAGMTPETSMKRDMDELREKERKQAKMVEEMRKDLAKGEDIVDKEEQKLVAIRQQIQEYGSAVRRFEMASAKGGPRQNRSQSESEEYLAPASMYAEDNRGGKEHTFAPASYSQPAPRETYNERPAHNNNTVRYESQGGSRVNPAARDEMLFDSRYYDNPQPAPTPQTAPQRRQQMTEDDWNPPTNIFSNNPTPPKPQAAAVKRNPPAASPKLAPQATKAAAPADDEVFTPDLFLGGK